MRSPKPPNEQWQLPAYPYQEAIAMHQDRVQKSQILQSRIQASQFVLSLDPRTLLPIELAAPAIGKSTGTFRSDLVRRPGSLPVVTRQHGRVFVRVADLIDWLEGRRPAPAVAVQPTHKRRGRPTKVEQARRLAEGGGAA
jgi:hypothetical protein